MTFVEATRNWIVVLIARMILRNAHVRSRGEVMRIISVGIVTEAIPVLKRTVRIGERRGFDDRMIGFASRSEACANARARESNPANSRKTNSDSSDSTVALRAGSGGNGLTGWRDPGVLSLNVAKKEYAKDPEKKTIMIAG